MKKVRQADIDAGMRPEVERYLLEEAQRHLNEEATRLVIDHRRTVVAPQPTTDPLLMVVETARRRLPPESWCRLVETEAGRMGCMVEWEVYDPEGAGPSRGGRRCWAVLSTARGKSIVAPKPFQTWQAAFEEVGIVPGEAPE